MEDSLQIVDNSTKTSSHGLEDQVINKVKCKLPYLLDYEKLKKQSIVSTIGDQVKIDLIDVEKPEAYDILTPPQSELKRTSRESSSLHSDPKSSEEECAVEDADCLEKEYLESLLNERLQLRRNAPLKNTMHLLDKEIRRIVTKSSSSTEVTTVIDRFAEMSHTDHLTLPQFPMNQQLDAPQYPPFHEFTQNVRPQESKSNASESVTVSRTILIPVDEYPKYNFIGRILGPGGMTVKQLEKDTGCRIMIRGRYSNKTYGYMPRVHRGDPKNERYDGERPSNKRNNKDSGDCVTEEADSLPLRIVIETVGERTAAEKRVNEAVLVVDAILVPPSDGRDELKRRQLVELAIMNGTYRPMSTYQFNKVATQCFSCPPPTPKDVHQYGMSAITAPHRSSSTANGPLSTEVVQNMGLSPEALLLQGLGNMIQQQPPAQPQQPQAKLSYDDQTVKILTHLIETLSNSITAKPLTTQPTPSVHNAPLAQQHDINSALRAAIALRQQQETMMNAQRFYSEVAPAAGFQQNLAAAQLLYSMPTLHQDKATLSNSATKRLTPSRDHSFKLEPPPQRRRAVNSPIHKKN